MAFMGTEKRFTLHYRKTLVILGIQTKHHFYTRKEAQTSNPLMLRMVILGGLNVRVSEPFQAEYLSGNGSMRTWPLL